MRVDVVFLQVATLYRAVERSSAVILLSMIFPNPFAYNVFALYSYDSAQPWPSPIPSTHTAKRKQRAKEIVPVGIAMSMLVFQFVIDPSDLLTTHDLLRGRIL